MSATANSLNGDLPIPAISASQSAGSMSLRIVRGPLEPVQCEAILSQYNQLTSSQIPLSEFRHWVEGTPDGPAWHALLENSDSQIVGHSAVIPLGGHFGAGRLVAGKVEYAFIKEDYKTAVIRGFEDSGRLRNAIMIHQLLLRCGAEGLGPFFISTSAPRQRMLPAVGCTNVKFPLTECLLVLQPLQAARATPNVKNWQRAMLAGSGFFQASLWSAARFLVPGQKKILRRPISRVSLAAKKDRLSFFNDPRSFEWRYLDGQYACLELGENSEQYVVVKNGGEDRYARVCQWRLSGGQPDLALLGRLVSLAKQQQALGVRWAVYGGDRKAQEMVSRLRKAGFVCAARTRALLIHTTDQRFHAPESWDLTDALFSFDP